MTSLYDCAICFYKIFQNICYFWEYLSPLNRRVLGVLFMLVCLRACVLNVLTHVLSVLKYLRKASCAYRFCWQHAIILVWKTWWSLLNQLNVKSVKWTMIFLIEPHYLLFIEMIDWNWHSIVSSPSNQNQNHLIWFRKKCCSCGRTKLYW